MSVSAELIALARATAQRYRLSPELVCAVVEQESAWNPFALRYEAAFYERYVQLQLLRGVISGEGEARARSFSWGLMQVMGQVAREHGFKDASLAGLCDPATGLEVGCRVLAIKLAAAAGDASAALLLWNGGSNRAYADDVLARASRYRSA